MANQFVVASDLSPARAAKLQTGAIRQISAGRCNSVRTRGACAQRPDRLGGNRAVLRTANPHTPALGTRAGYAAAVAEAEGPEAGLAILNSIDQEEVSHYQPYWAVRAHLLKEVGKTVEADVYDRAIGLAEDPAVREFLFLARR